MMGPKNLRTIRKQLRRALAASGEGDPIAWLEERMVASSRKRADAPEESAVLQSLRRVLEPTNRRRRRRERVGTKK